MSEGNKCQYCGKTFKTPQALGSHQKTCSQKPGSGDENKQSVNLKEDFKEIMKDVGVKKKREVITDIIFDEDAEDPKLVDSLLKQFGISNPARRIIVRRWSQRIGEEPPEMEKDSGKETGEVGGPETPSELLKWKLMEKLFGDSEEEETFIQERLDSIENTLLELWKGKESEFQREKQVEPTREEPEYWAKPCRRHPDCLICGNCGGHIDVRDLSPYESLVCPYCGIEYGPEK